MVSTIFHSSLSRASSWITHWSCQNSPRHVLHAYAVLSPVAKSICSISASSFGFTEALICSYCREYQMESQATEIECHWVRDCSRLECYRLLSCNFCPLTCCLACCLSRSINRKALPADGHSLVCFINANIPFMWVTWILIRTRPKEVLASWRSKCHVQFQKVPSTEPPVNVSGEMAHRILESIFSVRGWSRFSDLEWSEDAELLWNAIYNCIQYSICCCRH